MGPTRSSNPLGRGVADQALSRCCSTAASRQRPGPLSRVDEVLSVTRGRNEQRTARDDGLGAEVLFIFPALLFGLAGRGPRARRLPRGSDRRPWRCWVCRRSCSEREGRQASEKSLPRAATMGAAARGLSLGAAGTTISQWRARRKVRSGDGAVPGAPERVGSGAIPSLH